MNLIASNTLLSATTMNPVVIVVFVVYMLAMIGVGIYFYMKKQNANGYLLAGRSLNPWVASMSAQASDMSGWLLTGLPGLAFLSIMGAREAIWTALGLLIGTIVNWVVTARRLRIYTEVCGDAQTVPEYFENRFKDKSKVLRIISSIIILVFFTVYTASMFSAGAILFNNIFGLPYKLALVIGALIIIAYVFMGGFMAVSWTDLIQGLLMFFALIIVPFVVFAKLTPDQSANIGASFEQIMKLWPSKATGVTWGLIISSLGWGLGYFGMPHILVRFMAVKDPKTIKPATIIAIIWVVLTLIAAVAIGILAAGYMGGFNTLPNNEQVFMEIVKKIFPSIVAGILLSAVLAAIMSTADSQLLVASSAFTNDFYKLVIDKNASDKKAVWVNRITILVVSAIAIIIALNDKSSIFELVSYAWAGFGAAFGPLILFSLYCKRLTLKGAISGMITGAAVTLLFTYGLNPLGATLLANGHPIIGGLLSVYSLVPGFLLSTIVLFVVSYLTKPSEEIAQDFETMKAKLKESKQKNIEPKENS